MQHPSDKYPGFVKYIDRLLGYAKADVVEDEEELIRALDDAAIAVELVLGSEVKAKVAQTNIGTETTNITDRRTCELNDDR